MRQRAYLVAVSLIAVVSLFANLFFIRNKIQSGNSGLKVVRVIDGDTFDLQDKTRIRLWSTDAPEAGLCGYQQAKDKLTDLVLNKNIRIGESFERGGRLIALVYVNNTLVNAEILKSGWGRSDSYSHSEREKIRQAYQYARKNKLGIFSELCYQKTNPENPQCNIKGNIDKETDKKTFFLPECREYSSVVVELDRAEQWFCSEEEAIQAEYKKAAHCP
jgi:endonuclease YncB( thermonuclease family)